MESLETVETPEKSLSQSKKRSIQPDSESNVTRNLTQGPQGPSKAPCPDPPSNMPQQVRITDIERMPTDFWPVLATMCKETWQSSQCLKQSHC